MSAFKNLSWSAFNSVAGAAMDIIRIAIVARYLDTADFAVFAIALVVVGFCQLFSEGGVGNALVSKEHVSAEQAGNVLNFNLLIAAGIYLIVALSAPFIAGYYSAPALTNVLLIICLSLPMAAFARILQAMLQRALNMRVIAIAAIVSKTVGLAVAWLCAVMGLGIYALVWSTLSAAAAGLLCLMFFAAGSIQYGLGIKWRLIQPILSFSVYQLGEFLLNFFAKNFDVLLITKLLGAEISGLYVIIKNLMVKVGDIIVTTFSRYFHPVIAQAQGESDLQKARLKQQYLRFFRCVTLSVSLAYLVLYVNGSVLVDLLLGERYGSAKELIYLMALWLSLRYCTAPIATLWLARQKPQIGVYWNILVALLVPLAVYLSYAYGLQGVVLALLWVQLLFFVLSLFLSFLLTWRGADMPIAQLSWLLLIALPSGLVYAWFDVQSIQPWGLLLMSALVSCVVLLLAWRYRPLFFKDLS